VGVSHLVRNGNEPAAIRDTVIAELRGREEHGYVQLPARAPFVPGQAVQVIGGAFAHCFGLCEGMKDRERIAILLELLGRKVRVVLELDSVVAA
jgi:transcriptional antiterminator RfaH